MTATRTAPPETLAEQAPPTALLRRLWALPLGAHVAALVLALTLLVPLARPLVSTPDEGAYALQAQLVAGGRWDDRAALARFDPDGRWYPVSRADAIEGRRYPYVKHPLVPAVMASLIDLGGRDGGLLVLPLLGTLAAAVAGWFLAAELDPRRARLGFWLAAAGPLLVDGTVVSAHTIAAALAGGGALAALRIARTGPSVSRLAGLSAALVAGVLVRSESVLFAGALLAALGIDRLRRTGVAGAAMVALPTALVAAALRAERAWVSSIVHGAAPSDLVARSDPAAGRQPSFLDGRLEGIWHSTVSGSTSATAVRFLLPLVVVAATCAVIARRHDDGAVPEVALAGTLAVGAVAWAADATALVEGFVPAAPVLVLGAAAALAVRRTGRDGTLLWTTAGLFLMALYATQYPDGGSFQWGGRFLTPLVVPLAALAATGVGSLLEARPAGRRRAFAALVAALAAVSALHGVAAMGAYREGVDGLYRQVEAAASPVNITSSDLLPRMMWREDLPWLRATNGDLDVLLDRLRGQDVRRVTVVARPEEYRVAARRWAVIEDRGRLGGTPLHVVVLRR